MQKSKKKFFNNLYLYSLYFIKENSLNKISTINNIKKKLVKDLKKNKKKFIKNFPFKDFNPKPETKVVGMNSIGLLCDRLTILCLKINSLEKKKNKKSLLNTNSEIKNIILALTKAGKIEDLNYKKITNLRFDIKSKSFNECYFDLLTINLLLWESQEVLYNKNIHKINSKELRRYIIFFSELNIKRNLLITKVERYYWKNK